MSGYFKLKSRKNVKDVEIGERFEQSDYAVFSDDGTFSQFEYIEEDEKSEPTKVKPGIYTIQKSLAGLFLEETSFVKDELLDSYVNTKEIVEKADCFFRNVHKYKQFGYDVAKRNILLYGPAGTGKTSSLSKVCEKYIKDGKTTVVIFPTDKYEAFTVKDFIKSFEYTEGSEKLILVCEDIGGGEKDDVRVSSDSSLLSLLDNQEKIFKVPTLIIATTNYPASFMGNLTNRPGRFDDKIEVGYPDAKSREALLKFYVRDHVDLTEKALQLIQSDATKEFSAAHIRESVIRAVIQDKSLADSINEIVKEISLYKKGFSKQMDSMGFGN